MPNSTQLRASITAKIDKKVNKSNGGDWGICYRPFLTGSGSGFGFIFAICFSFSSKAVSPSSQTRLDSALRVLDEPVDVIVGEPGRNDTRPRFTTARDQLFVEVERDGHALVRADAAAPEFRRKLTRRRFDLFRSCHSLPLVHDLFLPRRRRSGKPDASNKTSSTNAN
jgi:hypothetical protein